MKLTIDDRETTVIRSSYRQNLQLMRYVTCQTIALKISSSTVKILVYRELWIVFILHRFKEKLDNGISSMKA